MLILPLRLFVWSPPVLGLTSATSREPPADLITSQNSPPKSTKSNIEKKVDERKWPVSNIPPRKSR